MLHRPLGARSDGREPADDARAATASWPEGAQLTRVIYHLNTRNEDSEGRLQLLQADYEAEIENLLQDASAKVAAASEEGGGKAAAAAIAEKVAALEMWNVFPHGPGPLCRDLCGVLVVSPSSGEGWVVGGYRANMRYQRRRRTEDR